jgi:UDP-N-acetylglucosamine acyltransferase
MSSSGPPPTPIEMSIHPTALVDPGARLGKRIRIGPYAIVEDYTELGDETHLHAHSVIRRYTSLGPDNTVHEGAVLGGEPQDLSFGGHTSHLRIGAGNRIREGVTMHRGTEPGSTTVVGSSCFLMAYSHVAHDCHIGDGVVIANNVALAGHVEIQDRAFLSGGVVVHQFCRIGRLAMIGGNSKIVQDCLPFVITDGVPGRARGLNVVGLRRAGVGASDLRALKEAYRVLLRSALPLETALEKMTALAHPLVDELLAFARTSKRGFTHAGEGV